MKNRIPKALTRHFDFDWNSRPRRFWRWWSGELTALAPPWLRRSVASADAALLIEFAQQVIVMRRWWQGALTEQGRLGLKPAEPDANALAFQTLFATLHKPGERVALCLSGAQCLSKQIDLPLAASENLEQVLGFEMDRHTPFKAEQVYFDFRETGRDDQRLTLKLVFAPRQAVDGLLQTLTGWGAPISAVYVSETATASGEPLDLMPKQRRTIAPSKQRWVIRLLLPLTAVLAVVAIAVPIWQKRDAVVTLMPIVGRARIQANETEALRSAQEKLAAEYIFMLDKKRDSPTVVALIDELSSVLPDDTWVHQFSLKGKELQIQGETASSSKLISLIENSKLLHNANFRAPLTKGFKPNSERYHLAADVKPAPIAPTAATMPAPAEAAASPAVAAQTSPGQASQAAAPAAAKTAENKPPAPGEKR